jgi:hypothetical protein
MGIVGNVRYQNFPPSTQRTSHVQFRPRPLKRSVEEISLGCSENGGFQDNATRPGSDPFAPPRSVSQLCDLQSCLAGILQD